MKDAEESQVDRAQEPVECRYSVCIVQGQAHLKSHLKGTWGLIQLSGRLRLWS